MNIISLPRASAVLPLLFLLSAPACRAAPVTVDPQALALLQKVQTAMQKTHSLTATFTTDLTITLRPNGPKFEDRSLGTVCMMKPNYLHEQWQNSHKISVTGQWGKPEILLTTASNGHKLWRQIGAGQYTVEEVDPQGHNVAAFSDDFFDPSKSILAQAQKEQVENHLLALTYTGAQKWEGQPYRVIEWSHVSEQRLPDEVLKSAPGGILTEQDRIYIGSDNFVHRTETTFNNGWFGGETLQNIKVNPILTAANFNFAPPPGAQLSKPYIAPPPPQPLLAAGTPAPDFAAVAPDGSTVHLSDLKGKVVVLDFWSTWCGPCQMSMPHLEKVYSQVKDKNVAVLGVCVWDEKPAYDKWVTDKKGTYDFSTAFDPAGRGPKSIASSLYHVSGIPTQYVIDKDGTIAASTVGYDEGGTFLETALNKLDTDIPIPTAHNN